MNKPYFLRKLVASIFAGITGLIVLQTGAQAITITQTTNVNDLTTTRNSGNSGQQSEGAECHFPGYCN